MRDEICHDGKSKSSEEKYWYQGTVKSKFLSKIPK